VQVTDQKLISLQAVLGMFPLAIFGMLMYERFYSGQREGFVNLSLNPVLLRQFKSLAAHQSLKRPM
jgi:hypothetical protein